VKKFEIGVIGAGRITQEAHLPVLTSMPNVRVAWIADADESRARSVARTYGLHYITLPSSPVNLPDCDVVLLAIPVGARAGYYKELSDRGVGVFVEKPFARTGEEHKEIVALFPPHLVGCGYLRRTYASTALLRTFISENWFGSLLKLQIFEGARTTRTGVDTPFLDNIHAAGGGILMDLGCHTLDLAVFITQASKYEILNCQMVFDGEIDRKVDARIRLFRDGLCFDLEYRISWLDRQVNVIELEFPHINVSVGTRPGSSIELRGMNARQGQCRLEPFSQGARTIFQAFFLEWSMFLQGIEENKPSLMSAVGALLTTVLMEDLYKKRDPL